MESNSIVEQLSKPLFLFTDKVVDLQKRTSTLLYLKRHANVCRKTD